MTGLVFLVLAVAFVLWQSWPAIIWIFVMPFIGLHRSQFLLPKGSPGRLLLLMERQQAGEISQEKYERQLERWGLK